MRLLLRHLQSIAIDMVCSTYTTNLCVSFFDETTLESRLTYLVFCEYRRTAEFLIVALVINCLQTNVYYLPIY